LCIRPMVWIGYVLTYRETNHGKLLSCFIDYVFTYRGTNHDKLGDYFVNCNFTKVHMDN